MKKKFLFFLTVFLLLAKGSSSQCPGTVTNSANGCLYLEWTTPPTPLPVIVGYTYNSGAGTSASPAEYRPGGGCGANQGGYTGSFTIAGGATCTYNAGLLPIHLKSIAAHFKNHLVVISWTTLSEFNNDVQMVERSVDGKTNWTVVGKVTGTNSNSEISYEVVDENPLNIAHYRVRSIDFDGKEQFSPIVVVRRDGSIGTIHSIQPNPISNFVEVNIQPEYDGDIQYSIMDVTGNLVKTLILHGKKATLNTHIFDMSDLQSGLYIISIQGGGLNQNTKIIKE